MFFTSRNLPRYLLDRGALTLLDLLDGDLSVHTSPRRNRNFLVGLGQRPGFFVKQVPMVHAETSASVRREAFVLDAAREGKALAALAGMVPRFVDYDPRRQAVVTELIGGSENLNAHHGRAGTFSTEIGAALATILLALRAETFAAQPPTAAELPRVPPWIFTIAYNAEQVMPSIGPGYAAVVAALRAQPDLCSAIAELATSWRPTSLIHGDLKWDNILYVARPDAGFDLRLVDWELADLGDPTYDLACALTAYLQFWLLSVPVDASQPDPGIMIPHAPYTFADVSPAMRTIWTTYADAATATAAERERLFARTVAMIGARLALCAMEISTFTTSLSPHATIALRLARVFSCHPANAISTVLGFGAGAPA